MAQPTQQQIDHATSTHQLDKLDQLAFFSAYQDYDFERARGTEPALAHEIAEQSALDIYESDSTSPRLYDNLSLANDTAGIVLASWWRANKPK